MDIVVFDEHHEALLYWESIRTHMPRTILHVDFHADMWAPGRDVNYQYARTPGYLNCSVYCDSIYDLLKDVSPTSFLIPSILRYGIERIIFLKPTGLCGSSKKITIGTLNGEGRVVRSVDSRNRIFFPDAITFEYVETHSLDDVKVEDYVLDIDLDYFCCNLNPERYKNIFVEYSDKVLDEIREYNLSRDDYRVDLQLVDISENGSHLIPQPDFLVRYNDNIAWIKYSIEKFVSQLPRKPAYISFCRSEKLGYTPSQYVQFIENYLMEQINKSFINVTFPMDVPLELSLFTTVIGRRIYNYCTEVNLELDDTGIFIVSMIQDKKATTREIVISMSEVFNVPTEEILVDIQEYICELRRFLIIK